MGFLIHPILFLTYEKLGWPPLFEWSSIEMTLFHGYWKIVGGHSMLTKSTKC